MKKIKAWAIDEEAFKKCWALENLQPMERIANIKKNNKFFGGSL